MISGTIPEYGELMASLLICPASTAQPQQHSLNSTTDGRDSASDHCMPLPRYDVGQRPLNPIHFLTNHPDRLLTTRI